MVKGILGLAVMVMLVAGVSCGSKQEELEHSALKILKNYGNVNKGANRIYPYEINIMAIDMLKEKDTIHIAECQYYIQWYLSHLNPSDRYGLSGTIYEYDAFPNGDEKSTNVYTSVDESAASFILLIHRFYKVSGFEKTIRQNAKKIQDIAYLIPYCQDSTDGLIRSIPETGRKYLTANCEDYAAIGAFIQLIDIFGWENRSLYENVQMELKNAIQKKFYRKNLNDFYYIIDNRGKYSPDWKPFSDATYAQLFPLLYRIVPNAIDATKLWVKLQQVYPKESIDRLPHVQNIVFRWTSDVMGER